MSGLRRVRDSVWGARWWIVAAVMLCAIDIAIRHKVFHTGKWHDLLLLAFYSSAAIAPAFLLGRCYRFVAPVLFGYWALAEALQLWVAAHFHMVLGGNWILMAFSTSGNEVSEFVGGLFTVGNVAYVALALAGTGALAWFFAGKDRPRPPLSVASALIALFMAAFSAALAPFLFRAPVSWAQISHGLLALNLPADTIPNWRSYHALARDCRKPPPYKLEIEGMPRLCVFVIGESTTRNHMSIYGYPRRTTPELEALRDRGGLTAFPVFTTTHPSTPEALCSLLTGNDLATSGKFDVILPAMLKKAGYRTMLISCQGHWQNRDVVGTHLFRACDKRLFLQGDRVAGTLPDEVALPELERAIREDPAPLAVFVHLYGCHNPASKRVPREFRRRCRWRRPHGCRMPPWMCRKIDSYDTAVRYGDHIVASIVRIAASSYDPSCVVFLSDHGESPNSKIWRDAKSRDTYEVPLIVWLSPVYRAAFPEIAERVAAAEGKRLWMDQLIEGLLEISGVDGFRPRESCGNFLSPKFVEDLGRKMGCEK